MGEQRVLSTFLIFTGLGAQAVICIITGSRKQTPKALFVAADSFFPSQGREASVFVKTWYLR